MMDAFADAVARCLRERGPGVGARAVARKVLHGNLPSDIVAELIENKVAAEPQLRAEYEAITDEQARLHFGPEEPMDALYLQRALRYFHAWRQHVLRVRIGERLATAEFLDIGDTDGLMLKHLGKTRLGFNLRPAAWRTFAPTASRRSSAMATACRSRRQLRRRPVLRDAEHVEAPAQLIGEIARVVRPDGQVFISIPWVPKTVVHPRDTSIQRGYGHVHEYARTTSSP